MTRAEIQRRYRLKKKSKMRLCDRLCTGYCDWWRNAACSGSRCRDAVFSLMEGKHHDLFIKRYGEDIYRYSDEHFYERQGVE